jgi:hypothetical protein
MATFRLRNGHTVTVRPLVDEKDIQVVIKAMTEPTDANAKQALLTIAPDLRPEDLICLGLFPADVPRMVKLAAQGDGATTASALGNWLQ